MLWETDIRKRGEKTNFAAVCASNHFPLSSGPIQNCASPPMATQTAMVASLPLRRQIASRIASRQCAPLSCLTPDCTLRSSSTNLWSCLSSRRDSRRPESAWELPSWWTTWTLSASPSPQLSQGTLRPAAGGARGKARGQRQQVKRVRAGKKTLQPWFKSAGFTSVMGMLNLQIRCCENRP